MDINYLNQYEQRLTRALLDLAGQSRPLTSDDFTTLWHDIAPEYMADAVPNVRDYPLVSIAWAGYFGLAAAQVWDRHPERLQPIGSASLYQRLKEKRGFDYIDELIVEEILCMKLGTPEADRVEAQMRAMGELALSTIRHEPVEPQTEIAFHLYARTVRAMYNAAVSWQLSELHYTLEKLN